MTRLGKRAYVRAKSRLLDSAVAIIFEACRMAAAKRKDKSEGRAGRVVALRSMVTA